MILGKVLSQGLGRFCELPFQVLRPEKRDRCAWLAVWIGLVVDVMITPSVFLVPLDPIL